MNKILGIVGSPRRNGNTDIVVQKILEAATGSGAMVESIFLADLTIQECNGCHACWQTGKCAKKDGMIELYPKISQSNIIIFGTPVYWYGPTALMKGFIDRFVYFNCVEHRPGIEGKRAVLVIPYEETDPQTAAPVLEFFAKSFQYLGVNLVETLVIPGVTIKGEVIQRPEIITRAQALGLSLAEYHS